MNKLNFLFGDLSKIFPNNPYHMIFLYIKQYMYNSRCFKKNLSLQAIIIKLKDMYKLESMIAAKNKKITEFDNVWNVFEKLLLNTS